MLVFTSVDRAIIYAGCLLADGADVAIVTTTDSELQARAFGGDPKGECIVDASTEYPPGLGVGVGDLAEWVQVGDETREE